MTSSSGRSLAMRMGLGLVLAALAQFLSLFLAGAGHGWVSPMLASTLLWVVAPVAFAIAWPADGEHRRLMLPLVAAALLADAWLIKRTIGEGNALPFYIEVNGAIGVLLAGAWLSLWLAWQAILFRGLVAPEKR